MINVLHVIGKLNRYGGTPVKIFYQSKFSKNTNHYIICIEKKGTFFNYFKKNNIKVFYFKKNKYNLGLIFDLVNFIKKNKIDIVHTHFARSNFYGRIAGILTRTKIITSEHGAIRNTSFYQYFFDSFFNIFTFKNISNSNHTMESVKKTTFLNKKNMIVIYNGIPDTLRNIKKERYYEENKFNSKFFNILNVGSHIKTRNHKLIFESLHLLLKRFKNIRLYLIGNGEYRKDLKEKIFKLKLQKNVFFLNKIKREITHNYIKKCDLFINATISEGFGIATVEAMMLKKPIIYSKSGSLVEILNSRLGYGFTESSKHDLTKKIIQVIKKPLLAKEKGKKARVYAIKNFKLSKFIKKIDDIYFQSLKK